MEFKGTKGKWSVGIVPEYNNILKSAMIEIHTNNIWVCKVQNNGIIQSGEGNHNALLISKAPEMLEMLKSNLLILNNTLSYIENIERYVPMCDRSKFNTNVKLIDNKIKQIEQLIKQATEL